MGSTFAGLEISKRGMTAQQSALYTTGQNISNANTPGYTRQRVTFKATEAYPYPGLDMPKIPGQMGTGVEGDTVERIRDKFLDTQYRGENMKTGFYEARSEALLKMEEIMNEPSEAGLSKTMDRFWQSMQDLAANPTNSGARSVVQQRGIAVADTFQYLSTSLKGVQKDLKTQMDTTALQVESIATQLNNINKQISEVEPHGYLPNDLYDERDRLIDTLSNLVPVKVSYPVKPGGNALKIAEGVVTVELVGKDGITGVGKLVDGANQTAASFSVSYDANGMVTSFQLDEVPDPPTNTDMKTIAIGNVQNTGKIQGLIQSHGYADNGTSKGAYVEMIKDLDDLANAFVKEFNAIHKAGYNLNQFKTPPANGTGYDFFDFKSGKTGAEGIKVADIIMTSTDYIAAAQGPNPTAGDGSNALKLAEVKNGKLTDLPNSATFQTFYEGMIGGMAVDAQEAERMLNNTNTLKDSVESRRQSVSAVSLDEEMTNMIQFQHAYNASARMITMQDQLLDTIINKMGL
ncbi:flagellar hook-associated protein FlgK [Bacillus sp. FJAT-42376]|uniref:flagellar hook-associated protein FlgK n=1 Tax=Bacillus sp. FJAT-42376 TaxID=2014076 RepID=UPI000F4FCBE3|nr:flagellar hook-associated protein FlgK [Bacillus sp. FJAT-42376]AZB44539.1 flagellar hook-associated protein FlgK [Bacillus sp. FJAT-42376]